jgi:hypothetical protein
MSSPELEMSCAGCGAPAPHTSTPYTLISAERWRLVFEQDAGKRVPVWRCPGCWQRFKAAK